MQSFHPLSRIVSNTLLPACRATFRENVEDTFTFDTRTMALLAVFMVGVPVLIYNTIVSEYNLADEKAGRKKKDFM